MSAKDPTTDAASSGKPFRPDQVLGYVFPFRKNISTTSTMVLGTVGVLLAIVAYLVWAEYWVSTHPESKIFPTWDMLIRDGVVRAFTASHSGGEIRWERETLRALTISPDDKHVYVTYEVDESSNALGVFARDAANGRLTFVEFLRGGEDGVQGLAGANMATVSPNGKHVYVASLQDDALVVFARDVDTGRLTFVQSLVDGEGDVDGLNGARWAAVSPDGNHVYVASFQESAVAVFARDDDTGKLTFVQCLEDGADGVEGLDGANGLTISPDGRNVYVASFADSAVVAFARDAGSGKLAWVEFLQNNVYGVKGLDGANSVTISPDGRHVYVASFKDDALAVFARDAATGRLTPEQAVMTADATGEHGLGGASSVTVSPDGNQVYLASARDNAVVAFTRNVASGRVARLELHKNGEGGVVGLEEARCVSVTADGKNVYAAGSVENAIPAFARDGSSGKLTFAQTWTSSLFWEFWPRFGAFWEEYDPWIWVDVKATFGRLLLGVFLGVLISVVIGLAMGCYQTVEAFVLPLISFYARIPPTAAFAVFFVLAGTGLGLYAAIVAFTIWQTLCPAVYHSAKEDVPEELIFKSYTLGASQLECIWDVVYKHVLPKILEFVRIQIGPAMIALIAVEYFVGDVGFGYRLKIQTRLLDMRVVFFYLAFLGAAGLLMDVALMRFQRWLCPWYGR
jgi:ABC-type nitrate/sulfonate/bicarbonate transport system permease component/6-phosphogluconolactonase (cycloisomerase 2 family)